MAKRKKFRFKCPCCGLLSWGSRLAKSYPLELVDVKSGGRGLIKNIFLDWDSENPLYPVFQTHFYQVLEYLLRHRFIDAGTVKKLGEIYMKAPGVFRPDVVFDPGFVYEPDVVFKPKLLNKTEVI